MTYRNNPNDKAFGMSIQFKSARKPRYNNKNQGTKTIAIYSPF